jgi:hypothetical protein
MNDKQIIRLLVNFITELCDKDCPSGYKKVVKNEVKKMKLYEYN